MKDLWVLEAQRLRAVRVWLDYLNHPLRYTCYDLGDGVQKRDEGRLWLHLVVIGRRKNEPYQPSWMPVAPLEKVRDVEESRWPFEESE